MDMFSKVCDPRDPTLNSLDLHKLPLDNPSSLVREYVGSTDHILKQLLLHEFHDMPDDDKHTARRNLIRLHSLTTGYGALANLPAIPTHKKLFMPNYLIIIATRRTLGLPLLSPHLANGTCQCGQPNDDLHLQHCRKVSFTKLHNNNREQLKFWLDSNHIYNVKEEQIGTSLHRIDLTTEHPSNEHS
jgi:hypothetical protein